MNAPTFRLGKARTLGRGMSSLLPVGEQSPWGKGMFQLSASFRGGGFTLGRRERRGENEAPGGKERGRVPGLNNAKST